MSDSKLLRTFLAVRVPTTVIDVQKMLKTTLDLKKGRMNWVRPGQIHLTLKFLGHTPRESIPAINEAVEKTLANEIAFDSVIQGTGCFPVPERPRVLWLGVTENQSRISALVNNINSALEPLGFPADDQDYQPHITIGRIKYPPKWTPDITQFLHTEYSPIPFQVARIHFMSSELFPDGPVYSILKTHKLSVKEH
jgi:2'-5' RNA ligase